MKLVTDFSILNNCGWSAYVDGHPQGNIFQTPAMFQVYRETINFEPVIISAVDREGAIQGLILAVVIKEHRGWMGRFSERAIVSGGPLTSGGIEILHFLLSAFNEIIKAKAIYSEYRNLWAWDKDQLSVFEKHGFTYEEHLDIIHDLSPDLESQYSRVHKGRRKNINRALRAGVVMKEIETEGELSEAINIILDNYKKLRIPLPDASLFSSAFKYLVPEGKARFFIAIFDEVIIGARFVLCFGGMIYDWYAGSRDDYLDKRPNDLLPWKVMEWGHKDGFVKFDFGGAGRPDVDYGVRDYKMKFGGELVENGRHKRINNKLMYYFGAFAYSIYKRIRH